MAHDVNEIVIRGGTKYSMQERARRNKAGEFGAVKDLAPEQTMSPLSRDKVYKCT